MICGRETAAVYHKLCNKNACLSTIIVSPIRHIEIQVKSRVIAKMKLKEFNETQVFSHTS